MRLVLLSGGSGKRLWPLSNDARSKQFLRVLEDQEKHLSSMVQRVFGQLNEVGLGESTVIATGKGQVEMLESQLGKEVPLIVEPERRDTFPAIALAASYLYTMTNASLDDAVAVLPVDPYVDTAFFKRILDLEKLLGETKADLALMGVKPTYPSEKYGYIVPDTSENKGYIKVDHFTEKPDTEQAKQLINKSALWNCGVFAFRLKYVISILESLGLPLNYEELTKQFAKLPKISFDYAVVEKAKNIVALPYEGFWKDLGTWNTLTEEMATKQIGNGIISDDSANTHLINELDIPVTVLGVSNAIVAVSPDGILVSDKEESPRIKEVMKGFAQRPMYEERKWGSYRVLDYTRYSANNEEVLTKKIKIAEGANLSYHCHHMRKEVWTIIKGNGRYAENGVIRSIKPGDVVIVTAETLHAIIADEALELIEVQIGSQLIEEDIDRKLLNWEEIEASCAQVRG
ncbi:sugar phosphate nucleotidyltransferase [Sporolactobacillus inulinus]|jgi:mannose-1-phosphate guanylyltransferase|uniref:Mannose-1-phosphate guanylyltransferase n=2 Tax=Sporolactobacillus inulinus TaxID=2078 RepID=A0A4Y1ZCH2_9BACL|nr:sugar phosphate nucleotidyltransferase [Sporolactobacillus inulinus]KLI03057.1 mannose-1-phosphate guanylyltransferase [Sporolactobacillus inulinus CASD]GAY76714.1 mannose-1-phosphate guanylyltransferase [Sporolactobacillus inulinus]GEB77171.1 mannose-1-phosphate guanylyltransferase [Sporolactobacillus inulinus]